MNASFPEIRVGDPTMCGALTVFPLYPARTLFPDGILDYQLSDEAQAAGSCAVAELSEEGVVGHLRVENTGTLPVLFVEGEELCGAKQNRVVRSSVLVGATSQVVMPVYCVERGRWDRSLASLTTGSHSPPSLRHLLKQGTYRQNDGQAAVWRFIQARHRATGTRSPKGNMSDALRSRPEVVQGLRQDLHYPEGASGIAVAINGKTVGIDLFDRPRTLAKLWERLVVLGLTLDAADLRDADRQGDGSGEPVRLYMESVRNMRWQQAANVGLGKMYRATDSGSLATVLVVDGVPIHLSMSMPDRKQGD